MRLATRCRKGWPDQEVGKFLRGADGSRPAFFVVATPFRSIRRAGRDEQRRSRGSARRRRGNQSCLREGKCLTQPGAMSPSVSAPLVVDSWCGGNHTRGLSFAQVAKTVEMASIVN